MSCMGLRADGAPGFCTGPEGCIVLTCCALPPYPPPGVNFPGIFFICCALPPSPPPGVNFPGIFFICCALPPPPLQVGFIAFFWFIMMLAQKKLNFNKR